MYPPTKDSPAVFPHHVVNLRICVETKIYGKTRPTVIVNLTRDTSQKNAAGRIIIVYDEDERTAGQAATAMCQRGFDNLFLLSGGKVKKKSAI